MDISILSKWADQLFDTGKRNNLVNFRNTKMGTAEIVAPDISTLFYQAEHATVFEVFVPSEDDEDDEFEFTEDAIPAEDAVPLLPPPDVKITKEQYRTLYQRKLKRGQVLVYNSFGKPLQALKNISKKGRTAIEETGVNILYLAFGFIHWRENPDAPYVMKAPILLVPVSVENESALEPFRIKVIDDEIIVNPTFSFKLQNEFGFKLPELEDEDIDAYFDKVEAMVEGLKWTVARECKLGIFSFLKVNMYQDLKNNADLIAKNRNVRALMGEGLESEGEETVNTVDLLALNNVVDADSSQSEAIAMAKAGKSFVLQGPPGTGKSQTITNIIAECLADGKRVLFVSEKLAALSVVYDKLKKAGLEEFCLELHSHKVSKRQVIEELCHTLRAEGSVLSDRAQQEMDIKKRAQEQLDAYDEELHRVRPVIEQSLFGLYGALSASRTAPELEYAIADIGEKGAAFIAQATEALERYVEYVPSIGYDYHENVWHGFDMEEASYPAVLQLKSELRCVGELCEALRKIEAHTVEAYQLYLGSLQTAPVFGKLFALLGESKFITPLLLASKSAARILKTVTEMQPLAEAVLANKAYLDEIYDAELYALDGRAYYKKLTVQYAGAFSRLFSKEYKSLITNLRLCGREGKKLKYKAALAHAEALATYQEKLLAFEALAKQVAPLLGEAYQGVHTDFVRLMGELDALAHIETCDVDPARLATMSAEELVAAQPTLAAISCEIGAAFAASNGVEAALAARFDPAVRDLCGMPLSALEETCTACLAVADRVDNWVEFMKLLKHIEELDIRSYLDQALAQAIAADKLVLAFQRLFYTQWVDAVLHDSPVLLSLARILHDEAVKRFVEKDELQLEINKARIRARVSAERPGLDMVAQGSAISILLREGEKRRKQKGVRQLLAEIGDLALTLKPCFLMSPLSVSTFLAPTMQFDVVVFDEASQIFPQDAIGAIYRGKQLIVVGDSKQMPPSNFFNASTDMDEDSEDDSITDFESVLDLCSTTFPQRRLKWHYRSRFEQLIAFSNQNFYDNELVTFPSAAIDAPGVGVDYHYVNGTFDRTTKTNRAEAERVVELVFENIERHPERSLGVVAFSISQQTLIERLIAKKRHSDPSKEAFFRSDRVEPFFVKNLETVQGDERDTIIFSIAYARDAEGRLLLNFGPINREGGERRLNVAVTRAKYNVQLVSSLHGSDIDLSRTQSVGVRILRDYLDYAENGSTPSEKTATVNAFEAQNVEFEKEVRDFLRAEGYEVDTRVGRSSFKVDIALKHPEGDHYLLAIECDGASYHASKTARDRDRLRRAILESMGWKFYRIWSTDWFRNKSVEQERLLAAVKEALAGASRPARKHAATEISFEDKAEEKHFEFPRYRAVNVDAIAERLQYDVPMIVRAVLEVEAPVSEEWMLKRLVRLYGREKVTAVVLREYEQQMQRCHTLGILRRNGFLYLQGKEIPMLRVPDPRSDILREAKYIATEELVLGLRELLRQNVSAEKTGLFRLLAQHLGFSRVGDALLLAFEAALAALSPEIEQDGEILSLK